MKEGELKLIISEQGKEWEYPIKDFPITIGRGPNNVIVLIDPKASRRHCVIEKTDEGVIIRDLGSRNGTTVNGNRVEVSPLKEGDIIGVGDTLLYFGIKKEIPKKEAEFCLFVVQGEHEGKEFPLVDLPLTIGRKRGNRIVLSDDRVSGEHAKVDIEHGRFVLVDLKSTNGTFIAGRKIEKEVLEVGTQFTISNTTFEFRKIGEAPSKSKATSVEEKKEAEEVKKEPSEDKVAEKPRRPDTIREEDLELDMERIRRQAAVPKILVGVVALFVIAAAVFLVIQLLKAGGVTTLYKGGLITENPSFEEEQNGEIVGWVTDPSGAAVRDPAVSKQGKFSLRLSAAPNKNITILRYNDDIPVRQGNAYRLHFQVRTDNLLACALRVDWLSDTNPNFHKIEYSRLLEGTRREWTPISHRFVPPPEASHMRVGLVIFGNRGECWVDEARLTKEKNAPNRMIKGKDFSVWLSGHGTADLFLRQLRLVQDLEVYLCLLEEKEIPPPDAYQSRAAVEEPTVQGQTAQIRGRLTCSPSVTSDFIFTASATRDGLRLSYKFTKELPSKTVLAIRMLLPKQQITALKAVVQGKKTEIPYDKSEWTGWGVTELIIKSGTAKMVLHYSIPVRIVLTQKDGYLLLESGAKKEEMPSPPTITIDVLPYSQEEKKGALELLEKIKALVEAERYQEAENLARNSITNPFLTEQDKKWLKNVWTRCKDAGRKWISIMEKMFEEITTNPRAEIRDAILGLARKIAESYPRSDLKERADFLSRRAKEAVQQRTQNDRQESARLLLKQAKEAKEKNLRGYAIVLLRELLARYPKTEIANRAKTFLDDLCYERGRK